MVAFCSCCPLLSSCVVLFRRRATVLLSFVVVVFCYCLLLVFAVLVVVLVRNIRAFSFRIHRGRVLFIQYSIQVNLGARLLHVYFYFCVGLQCADTVGVVLPSFCHLSACFSHITVWV